MLVNYDDVKARGNLKQKFNILFYTFPMLQ